MRALNIFGFWSELTEVVWGLISKINLNYPNKMVIKSYLCLHFVLRMVDWAVLNLFLRAKRCAMAAVFTPPLV